MGLTGATFRDTEAAVPSLEDDDPRLSRRRNS